MLPFTDTEQKMADYRVCVIIPTYNNAKTLQRVIDGVLEYTSDIIIINDGSTDDTEDILARYKTAQVIRLPENKGKGNALRIGFREAITRGYHFAVTIDSDGQHFPSDIPVFIETLFVHPNQNVLMIGSRNLSQKGIPKGSSFGNRFSNFWFRFETGIRLTDTQSGFRLYPLKALPEKFYTTKFEFEIEAIVRAAWKGVEVINIPIDILYDSQERVSHFRPYRDFARISVLNTILVFIALFYIKPRDFFRKFKKKSIKRFIKEDILSSHDSNKVKAMSVALGVFIGIAPLWGFQTFLAIFLAVVFRLNKAVSFLGSNISIPPMIPVVIYVSLKTGEWILPSQNKTQWSLENVSLDSMKIHFAQYLLGSIVLALASAAVLGLLSFFFLTWCSNKRQPKNA